MKVLYIQKQSLSYFYLLEKIYYIYFIKYFRRQ